MWFLLLHETTSAQRKRYEIGGGGVSLHWPEIEQIVKERLRLEESLIRGLKKTAANGNNKKRRSSRRAVTAK